ncbi:Coiled-coil protein [Giardia lamblia P15]|uniref:Coiled-coil protein n=1 Tax=Giardia intestinalis (strain P15) TaxID=658858 RepID=E1F3Z4_GIAIA|nr:Coiled-coil protein [Giardia lamblia P15]
MELLNPLPDDLADTEKDENSCSFCGVSYLILHEVERLKRRIAELETENASLMRMKSNAQSSQMNTLTSMDALTNLTEAFKARADEASAERDRAMIKTKEMEERNSALFSCIRRLQTGLGSLREEVVSLREALQCLKAIDPTIIPGMMDALHRLILNLQSSYTEQLEVSELEGKRLQTCLSAAKEDLRQVKFTLEEEIAALQSTLNEVNSHNKVLGVEVQELKEAISLLTTTNETLEKQVSVMTAEIDQLRTELQTRINQCNTLNISEKESLQRIDLLTRELQIRNEELADLLKQLRNSRENAEFLQSNLQIFLRELSEFRKLHQADIESHQAILNTLSTRLTDALLQLKKLEAETTSKYKALEQELADLHKVLTTTTAESNATNQKYSKLQDEQEALLQCNKKLSAELEDLRCSLQASSKTSSATEETLRKRLRELQRDNELLENQALDIEKKAAQLRSEKEQKEKLICDMDLKIQDMKFHITDLETKLAEKTREAESLRGETTSTKLLEEARKYISDLEKKIQCLQQTVFKECQERSDLLYTLSSLKAQNAELSAGRGSSSTPALPPLGSTGSVQPGQSSQSQKSQRGSMFQRQKR